MLLTKISIIVPTYNEVENVGRAFEAIKELPFNKEVVVVDDQSSDGTVDVVRKLSEENDGLKLLARPRKMGLGSAYKDGFKVCSGDVVAEMDADLSHNPRELLKMVKALEVADVVIGSRHIDGGRIVGWKWYRKVINWGANLLARAVLGLRVRDVTSGFRVYKRDVFRQIASMSNFDGFEFQVEAIYMAKKLRFKIAEVPITFTDRKYGESKLSLLEMLNFVKAVLMMRLGL